MGNSQRKVPTLPISGGGCPTGDHPKESLDAYDSYDKELEAAIQASIESQGIRPKQPHTAEECVVSEHILLSSPSLSKDDRKCINGFIPESITKDGTTTHMIVRGNGFCGFNSVIGLLIKIFGNPKEWNYGVFLEIIRNLLLEENFIDPDPSVIDEKLIRSVMRKFLNLIGMNQVTFAIIALDENTINVDYAESPNPADTFIILYKNGHFNALYCIEENRIKTYDTISVYIAS